MARRSRQLLPRDNHFRHPILYERSLEDLTTEEENSNKREMERLSRHKS
jgi:hypothetical protein